MLTVLWFKIRKYCEMSQTSGLITGLIHDGLIHNQSLGWVTECFK